MASYNIIVGDFLTIEVDGDSENSIELTKWVCDKVHSRLHIRGAFGDWVVKEKDNISIDGTPESDLSVARAAIGANW